MQGNDPKHTWYHAQGFIASQGINWWKTPAELPDLNSIENLWHDMKEFIRREAVSWRSADCNLATVASNSSLLDFSVPDA